MAETFSIQPAIVEPRKAGQRIPISSVERAVEYALHEWPTLRQRGPLQYRKELFSRPHEGRGGNRL